VYSLLQLYSFSYQTASLQIGWLLQELPSEGPATDDRRQFDLLQSNLSPNCTVSHLLLDAWLNKENNQPWVSTRRRSMQNGRPDQFSRYLKPGDSISKIDDTASKHSFCNSGATSPRQAPQPNAESISSAIPIPEQFTLTLEGGRQITVNRANLKKLQRRPKAAGETGRDSLHSHSRFFDPSLEEDALNYVRQFRRAKLLLIDSETTLWHPPARLISALMIAPTADGPSPQPPALPYQCGSGSNENSESAPRTDDSRGPNALSNSPSNSHRLKQQIITPDRMLSGRLILLVDGAASLPAKTLSSLQRQRSSHPH